MLTDHFVAEVGLDVVCNVFPPGVDYEDLFLQSLSGVIVGTLDQEVAALIHYNVHPTPVVEILEKVLLKQKSHEYV